MIPSAWVALQSLPLTRNGKVDRSSLPNPQGRPDEIGEYVSPRTRTERVLTGIWLELLQIDQVGVRDNFFELGGHSLHGVKLVVKVEEQLGVELPVIAVFQHPTIEQLATVVDAEQSNVNGAAGAPPHGVEIEEGVI
jgi:iturin family lipopeptide synthetase B